MWAAPVQESDADGSWKALREKLEIERHGKEKKLGKKETLGKEGKGRKKHWERERKKELRKPRITLTD